MLIHNFLTNSAKDYPDKDAVVHQDKRMSYAQLNVSSDAFAVLLIEKGIKRGDRVAIFLENSCEYVISYFGILKSSACVVALNSQQVARELALPLKDCCPRIVITDLRHSNTVSTALESCRHQVELLIVDEDGLLDKAQNSTLQAGDCDSKDLAMIIYTSGTTGKPKGVMLTHENLCVNAESIIKYLDLTAQDKMMVILPFYYSYGTSLLTTHVKIAGTLILDNRFVYPNVIINTMIKEGVTGFAGVPSHFAILIRKSAIRKYKFPALRYVTQAGGAMPPAMIKEFIEILPDIKFFVMYGQTEASARLSFLPPEQLFKKMGSVGKGIPGVELEILGENRERLKPGETGEIVARGRNIMKGYWNAPEETALVLKEEGLFTGDLARRDKDGFIYIISRKKEMIKSGANRISPLEIEDALAGLSGVVECAAVGVPDEILGEAIKLYVVVKDPGITVKDIMIFCKNNLAFYKLPKEVEIISELPKTASGKIRRRILAELTHPKEKET